LDVGGGDGDDDVDINKAWESIRIQQLRPQVLCVIMNSNNINHGLMKSVQNYWVKERELNCNCCRIQAKRKWN
jgi:hypothetical protein